jgi:2-oxoglutarate ferredoxin oxidoreductase subunit alpha
VAKVAQDYAPSEVYGDASGELLVVGWGGTFGALRGAVRTLHARDVKVSHLHLRHMNPLPTDLGDILKRFKRVLVPELNMGQLATVLKAAYVLPVESYCKMQGKPFKESEIVEAIVARLES